MSHDSLFAVTRAGLDNERVRLETATRAIASADTPIAPGELPKTVSSDGFGSLLGASGSERLERDPSNPMADAHGMVHYPRVDMVEEMTTLVSASRAYEANVRAFNVLRSMELDALTIGGSQQ